jgi:hypothetical protein
MDVKEESSAFKYLKGPRIFAIMTIFKAGRQVKSILKTLCKFWGDTSDDAGRILNRPKSLHPRSWNLYDGANIIAEHHNLSKFMKWMGIGSQGFLSIDIISLSKFDSLIGYLVRSPTG